jgi:uncharacterized tellurite resistance protein B-like protein
MQKIPFYKLLLKTAFCCMASDGDIDKKEVKVIQKLCIESPLFQDFDFNTEINELLDKLNNDGKAFLNYYFNILNEAKLSDIEELEILKFAINTIHADEKVEYSEIKFFKAITKCLEVNDEIIIQNFPEMEMFLGDDIEEDNVLDILVGKYFNSVELPKFSAIISDLSEDKE